MSVTMRSKLQDMLREQSDHEFLKVAQLPPLPKAHNGPTISKLGAGMPR